MNTSNTTNVHPRHALFEDKIGLILVLGAAFLLAGSYVTIAQAAPPFQSPAETPSALRGEALWAENCAPCHGILGGGDGPTAQMAQMAENPPTDFTDRTAARQRTLAEMFAVTKEGRMDRLMPPWSGQLSDDQIWDVVAYAQAFATSPDEIAAGGTIYAANCADCHGADGTGAVPGTSDFTDPAAMALVAPQALFEAVSEGRDGMPGYADQLSEEERWQVVGYVRAFGYEPIRMEGVILGQVRQASNDQPMGDLEVKLRRWQGETELSPLMTQADSEGNFRFEGLDTQSHAFYQAEVIYDGVPFPTDFVGFEPGLSQLSLPVSVYETTTSDESIRVERFHFIVVGEQPGFFSVLELYQFSNSGDRAYVGTLNQEGLRQTVRMALPADAQDLFLQTGTLGVDYLETEEGVVATAPVVPGVETFEAAFIYVVPYTGASLSLDRPLYYDTSSINGLVMDVGAKLESDVLNFGGERAAQGQTFLQYTGQQLEAGQVLSMQLQDLDKIEFASPSGTPESSTVVPSTGLKQTTLLWMMLGFGALAVALGLSYPWLRLRLRGAAPAGEEDLTRERQRLVLTLARLDQAYEAGELSEVIYRRARTRRKAELADTLRRMQEGL